MTVASEDTNVTLYQERFVAFVDILGFESLVTESTSNFRLQRTIIDAINEAQASMQVMNHDEFRIQNFSDSVIASVPATPDGLDSILWGLEALAWNLALTGIWVRGAVCKGLCHHADTAVFGPAVVSAYRLESSVSHVPRAVVSRDILAFMGHVADASLSVDRMSQRLIRDEDGVFFLNYFRSLVPGNESGYADHGGPDSINRVSKIISERIQNAINNTVENPGVFKKISWLAQYWNQIVSASNQTPSHELSRVDIPTGWPKPAAWG